MTREELIETLPQHLREKAIEHDERFTKICQPVAEEISAGAVPEKIYHYTDDVGLKGIFENGCLWFTDLFKLNDPSEFKHGMRLAFDALSREAKKSGPQAQIFSDIFRRALGGNIETTANYFVCCFSTTSEDLGQWRAYADDGRGYAIGFDAKLLETAFIDSMKEASAHSTFPVIYDNKRLVDLHTQISAETIPYVSVADGEKEEIAELYEQLISIRLALAFSEVSLYFKHEAYAQEQEYRFLQFFPADRVVPGMQLRTRPYSLVGYREFDWKTPSLASLKKIVCGPASDIAVTGYFAHDCMRRYLPANIVVPIQMSAIPYRNLSR